MLQLGLRYSQSSLINKMMTPLLQVSKEGQWPTFGTVHRNRALFLIGLGLMLKLNKILYRVSFLQFYCEKISNTNISDFASFRRLMANLRLI